MKAIKVLNTTGGVRGEERRLAAEMAHIVGREAATLHARLFAANAGAFGRAYGVDPVAMIRRVSVMGDGQKEGPERSSAGGSRLHQPAHENWVYRASRSPATPFNKIDHAIWAEGDSERVAHFAGGDYACMWGLNTMDLPGIRDLEADIRAAFAKSREKDDFPHDMGERYADADELVELLDPDDIVTTAGAWDDPDAVAWLWETVFEPLGVTGVRLYDGAVTFEGTEQRMVNLGEWNEGLPDTPAPNCGGVTATYRGAEEAGTLNQEGGRPVAAVRGNDQGAPEGAGTSECIPAGIRGSVDLGDRAVIRIFRGADRSTVIHESAHVFVDSLARVAADGGAAARARLKENLAAAGLEEDVFRDLLDGSAGVAEARRRLGRTRVRRERSLAGIGTLRRTVSAAKDEAARLREAGDGEGAASAGMVQEDASRALDALRTETRRLWMEERALAAFVRHMEGIAQARADIGTLRAFAGRAAEGPIARQDWADVQEYAARGFEQYVSEGRAPTPELDGVFSRMRRWLRNLYASWRHYVGRELSPEVRRVFDRLLAAGPRDGTDPSACAAPDAPGPEAAAAPRNAPSARRTASAAARAEDENGPGPFPGA